MPAGAHVYRHDLPTAGLLPHGSLPDGAPGDQRVWEDASVDLMVRGVGKSFTAGQPVLDGIEFSIPAGQSVALIGSNGADLAMVAGRLCRLALTTVAAVMPLWRRMPAMSSAMRISSPSASCAGWSWSAGSAS